MEKLLRDRLNELKSKLADLEQPKLNKIINKYSVANLRIRIEEIRYLLNKHVGINK